MSLGLGLSRSVLNSIAMRMKLKSGQNLISIQTRNKERRTLVWCGMTQYGVVWCVGGMVWLSWECSAVKVTFTSSPAQDFTGASVKYFIISSYLTRKRTAYGQPLKISARGFRIYRWHRPFRREMFKVDHRWQDSGKLQVPSKLTYD